MTTAMSTLTQETPWSVDPSQVVDLGVFATQLGCTAISVESYHQFVDLQFAGRDSGLITTLQAFNFLYPATMSGIPASFRQPQAQSP